tara:strand:- start:151 stop:579 length:429 start_codon:yes stop_codon:yes gene_type:complete
MASFANLNSDNIVINRIVVDDSKCLDSDGSVNETIGINYLNSLNFDASKYSSSWKLSIKGKVNSKRKGGIGDKWYSEHNFFAPPQPYASWVLNTSTGIWEAPTTVPTLTDEQKAANKIYVWNETNYQANNANGWELVDALIL